jgi:hypothetical protein
MSTSQHPEPDFPASESQLFTSEVDARSELAQAALQAAQLVIARWTQASRFPHLHTVASLGASVQARWYARAQKDFQAWLDRGGFAQSDGTDCPGLVISPQGKFECARPVTDDNAQCANACYD